MHQAPVLTFKDRRISYADAIFTDSVQNSSTFELKESPFGDDTFITGRTFPGCTTAIRGFTLKFAHGGPSNGPAA
jgi:hypothetical protein